MAELEYKDLWELFWSERNPETAGPLIRAYMPFVHNILSRMAINLPSHVQTDDLLQCAVVGLYSSIERFESKQGIKFETFATKRIRGAILDELRHSDYLTRTGRTWLRKIEEAMQAWSSKHGQLPEENELADVLGVSMAELEAIIESAQPWISLDQAVVSSKGDHDVFLKDIIADTTSPGPDQVVEREDIQKHLRSAFRALAVREQKIMYLYYFEELRLAEIAVLFDLTEARVCQLHAIILLKLKTLMNEYLIGRRK